MIQNIHNNCKWDLIQIQLGTYFHTRGDSILKVKFFTNKHLGGGNNDENCVREL